MNHFLVRLPFPFQPDISYILIVIKICIKADVACPFKITIYKFKKLSARHYTDIYLSFYNSIIMFLIMFIKCRSVGFSVVYAALYCNVLKRI